MMKGTFLSFFIVFIGTILLGVLFPPSKFQSIKRDKYVSDNVVVSHSIKTVQSTSIPLQHEIDKTPTENSIKQELVSKPSINITKKRHVGFSSIAVSQKRLISTISRKYNGKLSFWPSESGLGNNLYGLASAFLIAALTNKQLFTSGNYAYDVAFTVTDYWNETVLHRRMSIPQKFFIREYNKCFSSSSSLAKKLATESISSVFQFNNMGLSTNCPLFIYIIQNPSNRKTLTELGILPAVETEPMPLDRQAFFFYSYFMRTHVVLSQTVQLEVQNRRSFYHNRTSICMHIRCGNPLADFADQGSFLSIKDISSFYRCQRDFPRQADSGAKPIVIIASDSSRAKNMIRNYNSNNAEVIWWENRTTHTMTRFFLRTRTKVIQRAVIDLFSLSQCSHFVGTFRSTFSLTAAAIMGDVPLLVKMGKYKCIIPKVIAFG